MESFKDFLKSRSFTRFFFCSFLSSFRLKEKKLKLETPFRNALAPSLVAMSTIVSSGKEARYGSDSTFMVLGVRFGLLIEYQLKADLLQMIQKCEWQQHSCKGIFYPTKVKVGLVCDVVGELSEVVHTVVEVEDETLNFGEERKRVVTTTRPTARRRNPVTDSNLLSN